MARAVRFENYGGPEVLQVVDVDTAKPGAGEVQVAVVVAGINPGENSIRQGAMAETFPATFPSGQGSDFAGLVAAVGAEVSAVAVGDAVLGWSDARSAQADFVVVPAGQVVPKPAGLGWEQAGALFVVGVTAEACVASVGASAGDTIVVAGASGGVGVLATQLALRAGARVLAIAGAANSEDLAALGAEPVEYGDGLEERLHALAPDGVDGLIDAHGGGYVDLALRLGVPKDRVNTIIDFEAAQRTGVATEGQAAVDDPAAVLSSLAGLIAAGELQLPVYARYPLDEVRAAYERLAEGHGLGKIVLEVRPEP